MIDNGLRQSILEWIAYRFEPAKYLNIDFNTFDVLDPENHKELNKRFDKWKQAWVSEGELSGKKKPFIKQLSYRFGTMSDANIPEILNADDAFSNIESQSKENLVGLRRRVVELQQEWFQEGELKGQREFFIMQLEHLYGPLANIYQDKIQNATFALLERWSAQLLDAVSIEDVFQN